MIINKNGVYIVSQNDHKHINTERMAGWDLFDHIYCIHFLPFQDRLDYCIRNLKRLGIYGRQNFSFEYTVPNKYYECVLDVNRYTEQIDTKRISNRNINLQINRLNMVKRSYLLGYNRILILEDDNRFLKDTNIIMSYINNIPLDYNIVNMDYWFLDKSEYICLLNNYENYINDKFLDIGHIQKIWNMSFISIDRKGMRYLIDSQEKMLRPMDNYAAYKDENDELASGIKFAISKTNLSIQKLYTDRQNYHIDGFDKYYGQNLNYDDYE